MQVKATLTGKGTHKRTLITVGKISHEEYYTLLRDLGSEGFDTLLITTAEPPVDSEYLFTEGVYLLDEDVTATSYCEQYIPYTFERHRTKDFRDGFPGWLGVWVPDNPD